MISEKIYVIELLCEGIYLTGDNFSKYQRDQKARNIEFSKLSSRFEELAHSFFLGLEKVADESKASKLNIKTPDFVNKTENVIVEVYSGDTTKDLDHYWGTASTLEYKITTALKHAKEKDISYVVDKFELEDPIYYGVCFLREGICQLLDSFRLWGLVDAKLSMINLGDYNLDGFLVCGISYVGRDSFYCNYSTFYFENEEKVNKRIISKDVPLIDMPILREETDRYVASKKISSG